MPELPEVDTVRRGLCPILVGKRVKEVRVFQPRLRYPIVNTLNEDLVRQQLISLTRRAKYLIFEFERHRLVVHLGMSGSLVVVNNDEPLRKHDHVEVEFDDETLRYHDPRRFGSWQLFPLDAPLPFEDYGPEPLSAEFDCDFLFRRTRRAQAVIKNVIMNQRIVVGVGNIYASEALFIAGIRPDRPAKQLSFAESLRLVSAIKEVLGRAMEIGGTTLRDFRNVDNNPGYFAQELLVYGRAGMPCTQCQHTIIKSIIGQRSSYYCTFCQS